MEGTSTPRRARHLMDPDAPRPRTRPEDLVRLQRVQRWVLSVLAATTVGHFALGLLLAAFYLAEGNHTAQVGLCLIGAVTGMLSLAVAFAIHRRSPVNLWVALGAVPGLACLLMVL